MTPESVLRIKTFRFFTKTEVSPRFFWAIFRRAQVIHEILALERPEGLE